MQQNKKQTQNYVLQWLHHMSTVSQDNLLQMITTIKYQNEHVV